MKAARLHAAFDHPNRRRPFQCTTVALEADAVEESTMHPAFLRFPGGNYLEGDTIAERFQWKKTIGPMVDRPTHPSPWMYHSSDGMGLLEFLE